MFCNGIYKDMASAFLVSAMSFIEHILFVSVPLRHLLKALPLESARTLAGPGPRFAGVRSRETELSKKGASTPRLGFIPSFPAAPSPRPVPVTGKARGLTPRASASRRYTPSRFRYPGSRPILPALAAGQSGHR